MSKYSIPDDHEWADEREEDEGGWSDRTTCNIEIDVTLQKDGYQESRKWTVHLTHRPDEEDMAGLTALFGVEHRNKGNYWREGDLYDDAVDFVTLPTAVKRHVAAVVNRSVEDITPDERLVHRADGTGVGDEVSD